MSTPSHGITPQFPILKLIEVIEGRVGQLFENIEFKDIKNTHGGYFGL
jgi:hypothetical protein